TGLALGGNKTRKLEFLLGDALSRGPDCIITAGAAQSNHCRQTAAAAASLGLECHLVLGGEQPDDINGNLLLNQLFGAHIHWAGEQRKGEAIPRLAQQFEQAGKKPYLVPYGGSNEIGALAFIEALKELQSQRTSGVPPFSHIIFASSSGGTQAGLMVGQKILRIPGQVVGINIDKAETDAIPFAQHTLALANNTAKLVGCKHQFTQQEVILNDDYIGAGYGVIGELEQEAIKLTAQTEGILLDPVYTGKAMGGLIDMIRQGKITAADNVLFWHTGGAPALFAYANKLS
ncbi:MAG: D-cysteine desulfhydrase family pyridoxal phosphate-dependent enzyme, partial [Alteromonadaceae bacterium]